MLVLHAIWSQGELHLWGEDARRWNVPLGAGSTNGRSGAGGPPSSDSPSINEASGSAHPFAAEVSLIRDVLARHGVSVEHAAERALVLRLPVHAGVPIPSPTIAHAVGHTAADGLLDIEASPAGVDVEATVDERESVGAETAAVEAPAAVATATIAPSAAGALAPLVVPSLWISADRAGDLLDALEEFVADAEDELVTGVGMGGSEHASTGAEPGSVLASAESAVVCSLGESVRFFATCARMARFLMAQQRFVPGLREEATGELEAVWQPWLADAPTLARLSTLVASMPPIARAAVDAHEHSAWGIVNDALTRLCDAGCRRTMLKEELLDAVSSRDPATDTHVALMASLLGEKRQTVTTLAQRQELVRGVRTWIGLLEDRGAGDLWRLLLRLAEPIDVSGLHDFATPGESVRWALSIHLQLVEQPSVIIDAVDIWALSGGGASIEGRRLDSPHELLLAELGRGARLYKLLEKALDEAEPTELHLSTSEAYKFLREYAPILEEQGIGVDVPAWWNSPTVRLGAKMKVESEDLTSLTGPGALAGMLGAGPSRAVTQLGLNTLVSYQWQIAVGQTTLTLEQFQSLAAQHSPLVRVDGKWVEIRPEDVKAAMDFLKKNPGGQMEVGRALRLAYASDTRQTGLQILGMEATGWVASVFGDPHHNETLPMLEPPAAFVGTLRPYQLKGLSWLAFLDRLGLGACLADDMGLGKTIQLLALLAHERKLFNEYLAATGTTIGAGVVERPEPTLLVVPMSVVGNWIHEARRFTPDLKVLVHHGMERHQGAALHREAIASDVVITTYALAHRDHEQLAGIKWKRVVLDEAQNIKNPGAKQTQAIRALATGRRIALTGTPVENRLGELWSIMEFLNPGYLDPVSEFRRRFSVPIERYHDKHRAAQLRGLVQPFILRRLKSDPAVIADLPEKVESREYCFLTPEQATLYQTCVSDMLTVAEQTEGIQRRGVVLAGLIKLKQICNHPAHFLKEQHADAEGGAVLDPNRSGKTLRLAEMLREVIDAGDKALVFTQFRQMGHLLSGLLRRLLDRDVLFLHGGSTAPQREEMVSRFQKSGAECPVFILSLKAGGLGLNLTAATHVFHFDRWWNPAVESQATDRAYRIGQTRTVHVHKFVVSGTLEERIDQMIEQKTELAENVIGAGEQWLTELSTSQLREMLSLRLDAIGDDE